MLPGAHVYRYYLQILAFGHEAIAKKWAEKAIYEDLKRTTYDMSFGLVEVGAFEVAKDSLPRRGNAADFELVTGHGRRVLYQTSVRLFDQLDKFHRYLSDPLQSLNLELALYTRGKNPPSTCKLGESPLDQRLEKQFSSFAKAGDVPLSSRAATLALLDPGVIPPRDSLAGWYTKEVYNEIPLERELEGNNARARAAFFSLALHYGDQTFWDHMLEDIENIPAPEFSEINQSLAIALLVDTVLDRKSNRTLQAKLLFDYCQSLLKRDDLTYEKDLGLIVHLTNFSSLLAGKKLNRKTLLKEVSGPLQKEVTKSLSNFNSFNLLVKNARMNSRYFGDHTVREDWVLRLANQGLGNPNLTGQDLYRSYPVSLAPYYITAKEETVLLNSTEVNPVAKAVLAVGFARRTRFNKKKAEFIIPKLRK